MTDAAPWQVLCSLLDHAIDGAVIIDEQSVIVYANSALADLTGWPLDLLLGSSLNLILPESIIKDHDRWIHAYCQRNGPSTVLGHVREMQARRQDAREMPVELKAVDLGWCEGRRYLGGFLQDITARKALEQDREALLEQFHRQAMTDALTGLPNRRSFDIEATRLIAQMRRTAQPTAVAILDIDRFKRVNDSFGHDAGDEVLRMIARILPTQLRAGDFVGRVGGEEFGILMPSTTEAQAMAIMERLRETIGDTAADCGVDRPVSVTVSIGLTIVDPQESFESSWKRADQALYDAKQSGRNRTIFK